MKLSLYEYVYNPGLGDCFLLKKSKDKYLFFVPNNYEKFIITNQITGDTTNCSFNGNEYVSDLEEALKRFNERSK